MNKISFKNFILVVTTLVIAGLSIWLPGFLVSRSSSSEMSVVTSVPPEYYSGPSESIIKNASRQLTNEQCIQLITGMWESTIAPADEDSCSINEFGIRTLVINRVDDLYARGLYPCNLSSAYDQWYSWTATPYRALDTTFQTYAAIYWDITFTKYDNTDYHRFIVTESGDILYAEVKILEPDENNQKDFSNFTPDMSDSTYMLFYYGEYLNTTYNKGNVRVMEHNGVTTSYTTKEASEKEKQNLDPNAASFYINDFVPLDPSKIYTINQTSSDSRTPMKYFVTCEINSDSYRILMQPR